VTTGSSPALLVGLLQIGGRRLGLPRLGPRDISRRQCVGQIAFQPVDAGACGSELGDRELGQCEVRVSALPVG
jgi:hypothetical protein